MASAWKAAGGGDIEFSFDASSRLASQITNGAPVDLFFSADEEWMDALLQKGKVEPSTRVDLLSNVLVLVVPVVSKSKIASPADLKRSDVRRVALAGENVPAGRYARRALTSEGVWEGVAPKVVNAANVRQTLQLAASGEVEAAIVYRTDALADPRVRAVFTFPSKSLGPILYPAAVVRGAPQAVAAKRFLDFCRSDAAKQVFTGAGFGFVPSK